MEAHAESEVVLQTRQVEIPRVCSDLAGVIKEGCIQIAIDHDAPLALQKQTVAIAEPPARIAAQIASTAERGEHVVRNVLIVFETSRLRERMQRDRPRLTQDRKVLHDLVVHLL